MAADKEVIKHLNAILKNELTAINQYFLHSRMLKHQGYGKLAEHEYEESIDEMKHADAIMQRIFLLGGLPNLQDIGKLMIGETIEEVLSADLKLEHKAQEDLLKAHKVCDAAHDPISVNLIEDILASEEQHIEWIEAQLAQIKAMGIGNYLQSQR